MSGRAPIQVPLDIKNKVEIMQSKFRAKTSYEVIEKLVQYYESNERYKIQERERQEEERRQLAARTIDVGETTKGDFEQFMRSLGIYDAEKALSFLLCHYDTSASVSKEAFVMLQIGKM